jgi:hypothetical protein
MSKAIIPGQFISVDAMRGRDLIPSAKNLLQTKRRKDGFSTWDASGIFFELDSQRRELGEEPSAHTLLLLYAADLRFRLRWEIEPALAEGQTVIAAPYVETGIAFGLSHGFTRKWLTELFRFFPRAPMAYWVNGNPSASPSAQSGFLEFSAHLGSKDFYDRFASHFDTLEQRGKCRTYEL